MNKQDLVFLTWGAIWMVWILTFFALSIAGFLKLSMVAGILGFLILWRKFCQKLDSLPVDTNKNPNA